MKYRKRPVEVEARKITPANIGDIAIWCNGMARYPLAGETSTGLPAVQYTLHLEIPTLEGTMRAVAGDYVIKGVKGEFYSCRGDIFEETYDKVDEQ